MAPNFRRLLNRLRSKVAVIADSLINSRATPKSEGQTFRAQRMCPFCGLITPRQKRCCLECGKALKPA
jgi:hypothetical protein